MPRQAAAGLEIVFDPNASARCCKGAVIPAASDAASCSCCPMERGRWQKPGAFQQQELQQCIRALQVLYPVTGNCFSLIEAPQSMHLSKPLVSPETVTP